MNAGCRFQARYGLSDVRGDVSSDAAHGAGWELEVGVPYDLDLSGRGAAGQGRTTVSRTQWRPRSLVASSGCEPVNAKRWCPQRRDSRGVTPRSLHPLSWSGETIIYAGLGARHTFYRSCSCDGAHRRRPSPANVDLGRILKLFNAVSAMGF